jgi:Amt family ammonium transporter
MAILMFAKHFLYSTALVLFMTIPGLALIYAGMVCKKSVLATVMQSFVLTNIVTMIWTVVCYSLVFTPGGSFPGGLARVMLHGMDYVKGDKVKTLTVGHLAPTVPETVYCAYQMIFAIVTPVLFTGAFSDRAKFSAMLMFMALRSIIVYSPIAHMVWEPTGGLASAGILDFASRTAVHINSVLRIWSAVSCSVSVRAKTRT